MCVCTYVYWFVGSSKKKKSMLEYSFMACKRKGELDNIRSPADPPVEKEVPEDIRRQSTYAQQGGVGAGISGELAERAHRHTNLPFLFLSHLFLQPPHVPFLPFLCCFLSIYTLASIFQSHYLPLLSPHFSVFYLHLSVSISLHCPHLQV